MKRILSIVVISAIASLAWTQSMKSIEFRDQNIRDILLTLAELNGVSIVPDDTVTGKASYVFADMDFRQALQVFLDTYKLSYTLKGSIYYISRVSVKVNLDASLDVSAVDVPNKDLLRVISSQVGKTILTDNMPDDPITINVQGARLEDILKIVIARYPDFSLDAQEKYYYLRNKGAASNAAATQGGAEAIKRDGDVYELQITRARFKDLILSLFSSGKSEFVLLLDRDMTIEDLFLKGLSFEEALKALLLQVNADFTVDDGVYYIYEVQRKDLLKKYLTNVVLPFRYISSADFQKLLPPELNAGNFFRLDDKGNKIVLSGSFEEIKPIWDFIKLIDRPAEGNETVRIDLKYVKTDDVLPLLPADLAGFNPQALSNKSSFVVSLPEAKKQAFLEFVALVDQPVLEVPVHLRYMKADDLFAKLPPSVVDANVIKTGDQSLVFFKGSPELLRRFEKDLEALDVPRPLLRYEILVLQFTDSSDLELTPGISVTSGAGNTFTGALQGLLQFGFDIVGNFGIGFGLSLTAAISDGKAKVVADTTLNGLSGEKLSFQNTKSTYYAANEISTTGAATVVGSVNQLSSGLMLNLQGWISSDDMVTLQVDATLSDTTTSSSSASISSSSSSSTSSTTTTTTLPPNTTEKKLSTQVRVISGQPLVIGGLKEDEVKSTIIKPPLLGDIPLLGNLFKSRSDTTEHTEFAIYIVPILDRPEERTMSTDDRMLDYYRILGAAH